MVVVSGSLVVCTRRLCWSCFWFLTLFFLLRLQIYHYPTTWWLLHLGCFLLSSWTRTWALPCAPWRMWLQNKVLAAILCLVYRSVKTIAFIDLGNWWCLSVSLWFLLTARYPEKWILSVLISLDFLTVFSVDFYAVRKV